MNATLEKYGYPATAIADYDSWVVLLNPKQGPTAPRLVVASREDGETLGSLSLAAHAEFKQVAADVEVGLHATFRPDKLNWFMLMMVDRQVHYHVIPRFRAPRSVLDHIIFDAGWPKHPEMTSVLTFSETELHTIWSQLRADWPVSVTRRDW